MKKMKVFLALIAFTALIGVSAFTKKEQPKVVSGEVWFEYTPVTQYGPTDPANYTETPMGPTCSNEETGLCSVFAEPDPESGDEGDRKPLASSLLSIESIYGFDDYVEGIIHLRE